MQPDGGKPMLLPGMKLLPNGSPAKDGFAELDELNQNLARRDSAVKIDLSGAANAFKGQALNQVRVPIAGRTVPSNWLTDEAAIAQKTAREVGKADFHLPPGYDVADGSVTLNGTAVGRVSRDRLGLPRIYGSGKASPSLASGNPYDGVPEYADVSPAFRDYLRTQEGYDQDEEGIRDQWAAQAWKPGRVKQVLDRWQGANDFERGELIAELQPELGPAVERWKAGETSHMPRLDVRGLYRSGQISLQEARQLERTFYGVQPGQKLDARAHFEAWRRTGSEAARKLAVAEAGVALPLPGVGGVGYNAKVAAREQAHREWMVDYLAENSGRLDFDRQQFIEDAKAIGGGMSSWLDRFQAWQERGTQNVVGSMVGILNRALGTAATVPASIATLAPDSAAGKATLNALWGSPIDQQRLTELAAKATTGKLTDAETSELKTLQFQQKFKDGREGGIALSRTELVQGLDDTVAWIKGVGATARRIATEWSRGKGETTIAADATALFDAIDREDLTESELVRLAGQLERKAFMAQGWPDAWRQDTGGIYDAANDASPLAKMLVAYRQTGDQAYRDQFTAMLLSTPQQMALQEAMAEYASQNGLTSPTDTFAVFSQSVRGMRVAGLQEFASEVIGDVAGAGIGKALILGARGVSRMARAGAGASRVSRAASMIDKVIRVGTNPATPVRNALVQGAKIGAAGGAQEYLEEGVVAVGEPTADLGRSFHEAGMEGLAGGMAMGVQNALIGTGLVGWQNHQDTKGLKEFVNEWNRRTPDDPITVDDARQARAYLDPREEAAHEEAVFKAGMQLALAQQRAAQNEAMVGDAGAQRGLTGLSDMEVRDARTVLEDLETQRQQRIQQAIEAVREVNGIADPALRQYADAALKVARGQPLTEREMTALEGARGGVAPGPVPQPMPALDPKTGKPIEGLPEPKEPGQPLARRVKRGANGSASPQDAFIITDPGLAALRAALPRTSGLWLPADERSQELNLVGSQTPVMTGSQPSAAPGANGAERETPPAVGVTGNGQTPVPQNVPHGTATGLKPGGEAAGTRQQAQGIGPGRFVVPVTVTAASGAQRVQQVEVTAGSAQEAAAKVGALPAWKAIQAKGARVSIGEPVGEEGTTEARGTRQEAQGGGQATGTRQEAQGAVSGATWQEQQEQARQRVKPLATLLREVGAAFGHKVVDTGLPFGFTDRYGTFHSFGTQILDKAVPGSDLGQWIDNVGNSPVADVIREQMSAPWTHRVWFGHDPLANLGTVLDKFGPAALPEWALQLLKDSTTKSGIPLPGVQWLVHKGVVGDVAATEWLSMNLGEALGAGLGILGTYKLFRKARDGQEIHTGWALLGIVFKLTGGVLSANPVLILLGLADAAIVVGARRGWMKAGFQKAREGTKQQATGTRQQAQGGPADDLRYLQAIPPALAVRALARIAPARRANAIRLALTLDEVLGRFGGMFSGIEFSDGHPRSFYAVRGRDGVRLRVNLAEFLDDFQDTRTGAAVEATIKHELIHRAAMNVMEDREVSDLWQSLPRNLRQLVWTGYHAAGIKDGSMPAEVPDNLAAVDDQAPADGFRMGHEFVRMLIEDREFAGQVSEAIEVSPSLGQRLIAFLEKLAQELRRLVAGIEDAEVKAAIAEYEKRVRAELKRLMGKGATVRGELGARGAGVTRTTPAEESIDERIVTGKSGVAYTEGNEAIEFEWAVVDASMLNASNTDDGRVNPAYPQELQPRDRTSAASEAQVNDIASNANLDRLSHSDGVGTVAPMREVETARKDAGNLRPEFFETFAVSENGDIFTAANADFIRAFVREIVPQTERAAMVDRNGNLTQSGLRRIRNAVFAYAYGTDPAAMEALGRLTEDIDPSGRNVIQALVAAAPVFAEQAARMAAGALHPLDLTGELVEAVTAYNGLRSRGESVADYLAQSQMPGLGAERSALVDSLLRWIEENKRSAGRMADTLRAYAAAVEQAGDPRQQALFGDGKPPSKEQVWQNVAAAEGNRQEAAGTREAAAALRSAGLETERTQDMREQLAWLDAQAQAAGHPNADAMARDDFEAFVELASQWRGAHESKNDLGEPVTTDTTPAKSDQTTPFPAADELQLAHLKRRLDDAVLPMEDGAADRTSVVFILKPLALKRGMEGELRQWFRRQNIPIAQEWRGIADAQRMAEHYAASRHKPFYPELVKYFTGQEVIVFDAQIPASRIAELRAKLGPSSVASGSFRAALVGKEEWVPLLLEHGAMDNGLHMSDSAAEGAREREVWFGTPRLQQSNGRGTAAAHEFLWTTLRSMQPSVRFGGSLYNGTATHGKPDDLDYLVFADGLQGMSDPMAHPMVQRVAGIRGLRLDARGTDPTSGTQYVKFEMDFEGGKADVAVVDTEAYRHFVHHNALAKYFPQSWKDDVAAEKDRLVREYETAKQANGKGSEEAKAKKRAYEAFKREFYQQVRRYFRLTRLSGPEPYKFEMPEQQWPAAVFAQRLSELPPSLADAGRVLAKKLDAQQAGYLLNRALAYEWPALDGEVVQALQQQRFAPGADPQDVLHDITPAKGYALLGHRTVVADTMQEVGDVAGALIDALPSVRVEMQANGVLPETPVNGFMTPVHGYHAVTIDTEDRGYVQVTIPEMAFLRYVGRGAEVEAAIDALRTMLASAQDGALKEKLDDAMVRLEIALRDYYWEALEAQRLRTTTKNLSLEIGIAALRDRALGRPTPPSNRVGEVSSPSTTGTKSLPSRARKYSDETGTSSTVLGSFLTAKHRAAPGENQAVPEGITHVFHDGYALTEPRSHDLGANRRRAYHGTPHQVRRFSLDKVGTGEGAQVYGWGLYFAENREVAETYRRAGDLALAWRHAMKTLAQKPDLMRELEDTLESDLGVYSFSQAQEHDLRDAVNLMLERSWWSDKEIDLLTEALNPPRRGNLYTVELLGEDEDFLDWVLPMNRQSAKVQAAVRAIVEQDWDGMGGITPRWGEDWESGRLTGGGAMRQWMPGTAGQRTSEALRKHGVKGVRYQDQGSRGTQGDDATSNYVIFDAGLVRILEENGTPIDTEAVAMVAANRRKAAAAEQGDDLFSFAAANPGFGLLDVLTPAQAEQKAAEPPLVAPGAGQGWERFGPESLGVPRQEMPQVKGTDRRALLDWLGQRGITHRLEQVSADSLRPTQAEWSHEKVAKWKAGQDPAKRARAVMISSDDYVLDGHHQWLGMRDQAIPVIRLSVPAREALAAMHEFPATQRSADGAPAAGDQPGSGPASEPGASALPAEGEKATGTRSIAPAADENIVPQSEQAGKPDDKAARSLEVAREVDKILFGVSRFKKLTWETLFRLADQAFGGTQANGAYTVKDAYDAMEMGVNRYFTRFTATGGAVNYNPAYVSFKEAEQQVRRIKEVMKNLPTQTKRTEETDAFQQFSTVPSLAYVANWVAGVTSDDVVLEPSAGPGGLAVFARNTGARVIANELSPRRAALLKASGIAHEVFTEDAEQINNILPARIRPTVVVMNPPFSNAATRGVKGKTATATRHIEQALARLAPGGRLVAIVGEGMAMDRPAFRAWWQKMRSQFSVRANVQVNGAEYGKYGTTWDNQLVVIDKVAPGQGSANLPKLRRDRQAARDKAVGLTNESENIRVNSVSAANLMVEEAAHWWKEVERLDALIAIAEPKPPITGRVERVEDLPELLQSVRHERPEVSRGVAGTRGNGGPTRHPGPGAAGSGPGNLGPATAARSTGADSLGSGLEGPTRPDQGPAGSRPRGDALGATPGYDAATAAGFDLGAGSGELDLAANRHKAAAADQGEDLFGFAGIRPDFAPPPAPPPTPPPAPPPAPPPTTETEPAPNELTDAVYDAYVPRVTFAGAHPSPTPLSESAAMAAVTPPPVTYRPAIPAQVYADTNRDPGDQRLATHALESIALAGAAHQQFIPATVWDEREAAQWVKDHGTQPPTEYRRGFFIGDGTGAGKGRQAAGVILDNWLQGRKRHVWVSEKPGLMKDALRDAKDVTGNTADLSPQIFNLGKIKANERVERKTGIGFISYATLRSEEKNPEPGKLAKTRVDQIVEWLGADFDGVIAFDESHNMANIVPVRGSRGVREPSLQALAGVELQRRLPMARVVYLSATGATEVENLGYAERLGVWGPGTAFQRVQEFISHVGAGGVAAMELIAQNLKAMGLYVARSLSWAPVTYEQLEHKLTPEQRQLYDTLAEAWQTALRSIHQAMELTGIVETDQETGDTTTRNGRAKANVVGKFWGAHQRFFAQIITTLKMPTVLKSVEQALANEQSVVLQLVNTNASNTDRAAAKAAQEAAENGEDLDLESLDLTPKEELMQMVMRTFPVIQYETIEVTDDEGNTRQISRPVKDSQGNIVENQEAVAMRDALLDRLASVRVPQGPLEILTDHFGHEAVAEITGRQKRLVWREDQKTGERKRDWEKRSEKHRASEIRDFQEGKRRVLVFSRAGGTGESFHADRRAKNKQKRVHILLQPGWQAAAAVQGFGRTHRNNQVHAPHYILALTDVAGEKRFISSIARRLDQLGALTKGQRQTGSQGFFSAADNLESEQAREALLWFYRDAMAGRIEGVNPDLLEKQMGLKMRDKDGALLQNLPPIRQFLNRVLSLSIAMQESVFEAFFVRVLDTVEAQRAAGTLDVGVETIKALSTVEIGRQEVYHDTKTNARAELVSLELTQPTEFASWDAVREKAEKFQARPYVRNKRTGKVMAMTGQKEGTDEAGINFDRIRISGPTGNQWLDLDKLWQLWERVPGTLDEARTAAELSWDEQRKAAGETYKQTLHLLVGTMLPIWNKIPGYPHVLRAQTDAGVRMIGRSIPEDQINKLLTNMGKAGRVIGPAAAVEAMQTQGSKVRLANNWKLQPKMVSGEQRIELIGPSMSDHATLDRAGVFKERIQWNMRYFLPLDTAAEVLGKVLEAFNTTIVEAPGARVGGEGTSQESAGTAALGSNQRLAEVDRGGLSEAEEWEALKVAARQKRTKLATEFKDFVDDRLRSAIDEFGEFPKEPNKDYDDDRQFESYDWAGHSVSRYRDADENGDFSDDDWTKWQFYTPQGFEPAEEFASLTEALEWMKEEVKNSKEWEIESGKTYLSDRERLLTTYHVMSSIALPPGWELESAQDSQYGSKYWNVRAPVEGYLNGNAEDPIRSNYKLSVRSHEPSPAREEQFGAVDYYVPLHWEKGDAIETADLFDLSEAMERLENWMWRVHQRIQKSQSTGSTAIEDVAKPQSIASQGSKKTGSVIPPQSGPSVNEKSTAANQRLPGQMPAGSRGTVNGTAQFVKAQEEATAAQMAQQQAEAERGLGHKIKGAGMAGMKREAAEMWANLVSGNIDRLEFYAPGFRDIWLDSERKLGLARAAVNGVMDKLHDRAKAGFGYPAWWKSPAVWRRWKAFQAQLLPVAARIEVEGVNPDGSFVFKPFDMRAGEIDLRKVHALHKQAGDTITVNGETLVIGRLFEETASSFTSAGVVRQKHLLLRPMSAEAQRQVYEAFVQEWADFPVARELLDEFVMPGMEGAREVGPRGVRTAAFNRYALLDFFNEWPPELQQFYGPNPLPAVPQIPGYTPDLFTLRGLSFMIAGLAKAFKSGARQVKSGAARESGNVQNLMEGFQTRLMEAHREKISLERRSRVIEAAAQPMAKVPQDERHRWLPLNDAFHKLYELAVVARGLDRSRYPKITGALSPQQEALMRQLVGEAWQLRGRNLAVPEAIYKDLVGELAVRDAENLLLKVAEWFLDRFNAASLATSGYIAMNWLGNEIMKTSYTLAQALKAGAMLAVGEGGRARLAFDTFAHMVKGMVLDRFPLRQQRIRDIVPRELFDNEQAIRALKGLSDTVADNLKSVNVGGAILAAMRSGNWDVGAKVQLAHATYRAHMLAAWRAAGKPKDRAAWMQNWLENDAPASLHREVQLAAGLFLMDYQNVPRWMDAHSLRPVVSAPDHPARGVILNQALRLAIKALIPFIRWQYSFVKSVKRQGWDAGVKQLAAGRSARERAEGAANLAALGLMVFLPGLIAVLGEGGDEGGDDDEELTAELIGRVQDMEGGKLPQALSAKNRFNASALLRILATRMGLDGMDFSVTDPAGDESDLWLRYRNYPYIKEGIVMGLLAVGDREAFGQSWSSLFQEYASLGLGWQVAETLFGARDQYGTPEAQLAGMATDVALSPVLPHRMMRDVGTVVSPQDRRLTPSKRLDYQPGAVEGVMSRIPGLKQSLPLAGEIAAPKVLSSKSSVSPDERRELAEHFGIDLETVPHDPKARKDVFADLMKLRKLGGTARDVRVTPSPDTGKPLIAYPNPDTARRKDRFWEVMRSVSAANLLPVKREAYRAAVTGEEKSERAQ